MRGPFFCLLLFPGLAVATQVDVPFRISRGMILVDATLQGSSQPRSFILDSGAGATVLAKKTAEESNLPLSGQERIRTVRGVENASRAGTTAIRLGTLRFSPNPLVVDLSRESRSLGTRVDGLLGADFFEGRVIEIDFKSSRLRVAPESKPGAQATKLPLSRGRDGMFIGLTVGDSSLRRVRVDTGCSRSLCWSPSNGSLRGLWGDGKTMKMNVEFGSRVMPGVPTDVYRQPLFAGEDGLLGTALLSRFESVWIDSVNHRISFENAGD